jgi:hypothetical protein
MKLYFKNIKSLDTDIIMENEKTDKTVVVPFNSARIVKIPCGLFF